MNHFIYAMKSSDPAPAAGGDTKSWFEYYKWDVDGHAFIPYPDAALGFEHPNSIILWFVMDGVLLGCVPVDGFMPCLQDGIIEFHYDTRHMQVAPTGEHAYTFGDQVRTGKAADQSLFTALKQTFDAQHPPRNQAAAEDLPQVTT